MYWSCSTEVGAFFILKRDNKFLLKFGGIKFTDKILGEYDTPEQAADALWSGAIGIIDLPSGDKIDTSGIDFPVDISRWGHVRQQH